MMLPLRAREILRSGSSRRVGGVWACLWDEILLVCVVETKLFCLCARVCVTAARVYRIDGCSVYFNWSNDDLKGRHW